MKVDHKSESVRFMNHLTDVLIPEARTKSCYDARFTCDG